jgi:type IV pilus assembly protein PilB
MSQVGASKRLGQLLIEESLISKEQLQEALNEQMRSRERLGAILIKKGFINATDLAVALAKQLKLPLVNPLKINIPDEIQNLILQETAEKYQAVPFGLTGNVLHVATSDPTNRLMADDLRFLTQKAIKIHVAPENAIKQILEHRKASSNDSLDEALLLLSWLTPYSQMPFVKKPVIFILSLTKRHCALDTVLMVFFMKSCVLL